MEVHPSALKHGLPVEDIQHAVRNAMVSDDLEDDLRLYLGPSRSASLIEVTAAGGVTMAKKSYGRTATGKPITEELVETLATRGEHGFDPEEIVRRRGGRPTMGSSAASVESVRLDPELSEALRERAEHEGRTNSELIRDALRRYLQAS